MKHSMVTLRLHKIAVIFIIVGAVLLAVFIFAGGYLLGARKALPPGRPGFSPAPASPTAGLKPGLPDGTSAPQEPSSVRVAMFDTEAEAKDFVQQLAARKLTGSIVPLTTSAGVTLYTIEVGPYATRAAADAAAKKLADDYGLRTAVIPAGAAPIKAP